MSFLKMDRSVQIQKTIRENNEDLQNFMRDLKHWESDMKRKDLQLSSKEEPKEFLPPVRSKPRKEKKLTSENVIKEKPNKSKRIASYDYSSWEKFDVEKACEEVDKSGNTKSESDSGSDGEEESARLQQQAMYEKGLGNDCVKKEEWKEAIEHYTKAIKCYNKDAIFYANRALCYLKTNKYNAAEDDCTESLRLDSSYVKAYQRRAAARIALKKNVEAKSDLNAVLKLEPNNTQAKRDLDKLKSDCKSCKEKPQEKISSKKPSFTKTASSSSENSNEKLDNTSKVSKNVTFRENCDGAQEYLWDPVDPSRIVKPINKPPHLRSKKPLKRIEIIDVEDSPKDCASSEKKPDFTSISFKDSNIPISINKNADNLRVHASTENASDNLLKGNVSEMVNEKDHDKIVDNTIYTSVVPTQDITLEVPPPAKTSVQFYVALKKLKGCPDLLYQYLKKIDGKNFPSIFQDSLESDAFSCIINILASEFIKCGSPVSSYLIGLTNIRRFEMLVLFMAKSDKEGIKNLLDYCLTRKEINTDDLAILKKKFQLC